MKLLKLLSFLGLLTASVFASAHDRASGQCKAIPSTNVVTERPVIFRLENYMVVDRHVRLSGLEGSDCGTGFVINNLEISSDRLELGEYRGSFNCMTDVQSYSEDGFANFDFVREVVSGASPHGILEVQMIGDNCVVRYHSSDHDVRSRNRDFFCNGSVDSDERVTCQHVRHLKKKKLVKPTLVPPAAG